MATLTWDLFYGNGVPGAVEYYENGKPRVKYLRFGIVEDFFGRVTLLGSACDGGGSGVDQGAQQRFVAHDLDVVLDAGPVRHPVE